MPRKRNPYADAARVRRGRFAGTVLLLTRGREYFRELGTRGGHATAELRRGATVHLDARIYPEQRVKLAQVAALAGVSRAFVVREALANYFQRWEEEHGPLPSAGGGAGAAGADDASQQT
jgi:hypothetical protein